MKTMKKLLLGTLLLFRSLVFSQKTFSTAHMTSDDPGVVALDHFNFEVKKYYVLTDSTIEFRNNKILSVKKIKKEILNESVSILVFDITGKQIENKVVNTSDIENLTLGQNYTTGVYNIIISQGMNTKAFRVMKE